MKARAIDCMECSTLPEVTVALYHDRAKLARDLTSRGMPVGEFLPSDAQTITERNGTQQISFVLMEYSGDLHSEVGLLAHEALHVAWRYFEHIGEESPAEEETAYVVGSVTGALVDAHMEWRARHGS